MFTAFRLSPGRVAALAVLALAAFASPGRADGIDDSLLKKSPLILDTLEKAGVKTVGVLKFQFQKGQEKPDYFGGRLTSLMATRLENILIASQIRLEPEDMIAVTRGASDVAAATKPTSTWETAEGRAELLKGKYPLAWGKDEVAVGGFLTGLIQVSPDYAKTRVIVKFFSAKTPEPVDVVSVEVPTTRLILTDLNKTFLTTRQLIGGVRIPQPGETQEDVVAQVDVLRSEKVLADPQKREQAFTLLRNDFDKLLEFKVFYDNAEMSPSPDAASKWRLPTPSEGQTLKFNLKAKETSPDERLGVVIRVNGVNTLGNAKGQVEDDERAPADYSMWVLRPSKQYSISGVYLPPLPGEDKGKKLVFKALSNEESKVYPLADPTKRGMIEVFVFRQKKEPVKPPIKPVITPPEPQEEIPDAFYRQTMRAESPEKTAQLVMARTRQAAVSRGIFAPSLDPKAFQPAESVQFNNIELVGSITMVYFDPKRN